MSAVSGTTAFSSVFALSSGGANLLMKIGDAAIADPSTITSPGLNEIVRRLAAETDTSYECENLLFW